MAETKVLGVAELRFMLERPLWTVETFWPRAPLSLSPNPTPSFEFEKLLYPPAKIKDLRTVREN